MQLYNDNNVVDLFDNDTIINDITIAWETGLDTRQAKPNQSSRITYLKRPKVCSNRQQQHSSTFLLGAKLIEFLNIKREFVSTVHFYSTPAQMWIT